MSGRAWKAIAILSLIIGIGTQLSAWLMRRNARLNPASIVTQIKPLNQLTTVRYSIQRVIGIREPKQPFGEESLLLMVQGDVLAGVDLANFTQKDVHFLNGHTVAIHLPAPTILQTFIDEKNTKVWDRQITWWTPWVGYDPELEHKARMSALDEIRNAAISGGILSQAQKSAQTSIRDFLATMQIDANFEGT